MVVCEFRGWIVEQKQGEKWELVHKVVPLTAREKIEATIDPVKGARKYNHKSWNVLGSWGSVAKSTAMPTIGLKAPPEITETLDTPAERKNPSDTPKKELGFWEFLNSPTDWLTSTRPPEKMASTTNALPRSGGL